MSHRILDTVRANGTWMRVNGFKFLRILGSNLLGNGLKRHVNVAVMVRGSLRVKPDLRRLEP